MLNYFICFDRLINYRVLVPLERATSLLENLIPGAFNFLIAYFYLSGCVPMYAGKFSCGESTLDPLTRIGFVA